MLAQHGAHRDIDRAAGRVGGDRPALEVLDLLDRAVRQHHELVAVEAHIAVLELVGDHPQIIHAGVLDGDRQRRVGEIGDLKLARRQRRNHRRGTGETRDLQLVGFAEVPGEILLLDQHGGPVRDRHHVGQADSHRLGGLGRAGVERESAQ